jgi:hypothetical protein
MNPSTVRRAKAGNAEAQHALGEMYENGVGVPKDPVEAMMWFRKAAEQGHPDAQWHLGIKYAMGQGVLTDPVEAMMWVDGSSQLTTSICTRPLTHCPRAKRNSSSPACCAGLRRRRGRQRDARRRRDASGA